MVRIINYQKRQAEDGREFFILVLQGGIELVKSQETGKFYVTARKAGISSTFDELTCKSLVGTEIPGCIVKVKCEPYKYTVKETGEELTLTHRFEYSDSDVETKTVEKSETTIEHFMTSTPQGNTFSKNGELVH
ncbi:hypothetical protein [Flavobacterium sp.]|uniref:hypothetical protein n=1 Tax=Flavobacterium sp. TaxID=239 RepID=UPI0035271795